MRHLSTTSFSTSKSTTPGTRSGFTLLELLAVITIISILLALILPAIGGVLRRARIAEVSTEFTQLDQALTTFKSKFGDYPPSSLSIPASGGTWSPADRAKIRAIWPQFNFASRGGLASSVPAIHLNGAECLVFFLGGVNAGTTDTPNLVGFSQNPLTPWTASGNPVGPFFEFDASRLVSVDGDDALELLDPMPDQQSPILYISSTGGGMNKDNDAAADDYDVFPDSPLTLTNHTSRNMAFPYTKGDATQPYNHDTFQLISPGEDGLYGVGGGYAEGTDLSDRDLNGDNNIQNADANSNSVLDVGDYLEPRRVESDNITNFSGGTLN
ncbi:MAG: prepilin-type N-terminal cleavage/methylation domain-containing protein [Planctomycetaceae bacterium]|nr:prepilin-type N-terminal cleavage/methylation domain-containing protein [Planctomycetaceae bacterium]